MDDDCLTCLATFFFVGFAVCGVISLYYGVMVDQSLIADNPTAYEHFLEKFEAYSRSTAVFIVVTLVLVVCACYHCFHDDESNTT